MGVAVEVAVTGAVEVSSGTDVAAGLGTGLVVGPSPVRSDEAGSFVSSDGIFCDEAAGMLGRERSTATSLPLSPRLDPTDPPKKAVGSFPPAGAAFIAAETGASWTLPARLDASLA